MSTGKGIVLYYGNLLLQQATFDYFRSPLSVALRLSPATTVHEFRMVFRA